MAGINWNANNPGAGQFSYQSMNVKSYLSPGDPTAPANGLADNGWGNRGGESNLALTSYAPNYFVFGRGYSGPTPNLGSIPRSFPDGTSNTIVYVEIYSNCNAVNNNNLGQNGPMTTPTTPATGTSTPRPKIAMLCHSSSRSWPTATHSYPKAPTRAASW